MRPEQLGMPLAYPPALGRADFLVSPSNALAVSLVDRWPDWPSLAVALTGPEGAGKTHLAHVWAMRAGARLIAADDLCESDLEDRCRGPVAVEDVPAIGGDPERETALFHLCNLLRDAGQPLLVTGRGPVAGWPLALPDLKSRMQAATAAAIEPPDDALLAAVLVKHFADRQFTPPANLIAYLITRIDRSFAAARQVVEDLDRAALARKRPITRALAVRLLDNGDGSAEYRPDT